MSPIQKRRSQMGFWMYKIFQQIASLWDIIYNKAAGNEPSKFTKCLLCPKRSRNMEQKTCNNCDHSIFLCHVHLNELPNLCHKCSKPTTSNEPIMTRTQKLTNLQELSHCSAQESPSRKCRKATRKYCCLCRTPCCTSHSNIKEGKVYCNKHKQN